MRFEVLQSLRDVKLHVLLHESGTLPGSMRYMGPWQQVAVGAIEDLKADCRQRLVQDGYAVHYPAAPAGRRDDTAP